MMAGLQEERTANDAAYVILVMLTWLSILLSPILLGMYISAIMASRD